MEIPSAISGFRNLVHTWIKSVLHRFVINKFSDTDNTIYLTFDDGPCEKNTEIIYKALKDMGVNAGFFFNGDAVVRQKALVNKIHSDGYYVGNHSYYHNKYSWNQWFQELASIHKGKEVIASITECSCKFYRPPFGKVRIVALVYLFIIKAKIILWSIDSRDFEATYIGEIINNINGVVSGDVLLFHSDCDLTATHIRSIVYELSAQGFRFGNLSEALHGVYDGPR